MVLPDRIVMVAFGEVYHSQAALCIRSIRQLFDGPIDILAEASVPGATLHRAELGDFSHPALARLLLPDILNLRENEAVLYLDCDFLVRESLTLPELGDRVMVYGYPQRTQSQSSFAGQLTDDPSILSQQAFCSGLLYYRPTRQICDAFKSAYANYTARRHKKIKIKCHDQPHINLELCSRNLVDYGMTPLVWEYRFPRGQVSPSGPRNRQPIPPERRLVHFCGIGRAVKPLKAMQAVATEWGLKNVQLKQT